MTYVAFLRGIMPSNPNMRNEKLRGIFESLGFSNVQTLISSGNVIFDTKSSIAASGSALKKLELKIEKALFEQLGIKSPAYVRSREEIGTMIQKNPFKGATHSPASYLIVSFLKKEPGEIFTELDMTSKAPSMNGGAANFMSVLDKKYGKEVTTRTWKTVERVFKKMSVAGNS
jgi:uncharacterized protein (DUF1697 family)